jgi:acyl-CoA thioesterase I
MIIAINNRRGGSSGDRLRLSSTSSRFGKDRLYRACRIAYLGAAIVASATETAHSQDPANVTAAEICLAANSNLSLGVRLPRTGDRLKSGELLKIVAIGSSSTVGLWEFRPTTTYPDVMRREILRLQPNARIDITNSGRVGDTIPGNVARFERDVFSFKPDLVLWQLGTNDIAWGGHTDDQLKDKVISGVRSLKASGADVVLMDLQYTPMVLASAYYSRMQAIISEVARQERIGLFSRFTLMRKSIDAGVPPGALVAWDRLHNSTEGYDCIGRALARAIVANAH